MVSKLRLKCGHLVIFLCPKTCTKAHIQNGTQPDFIAKEMWPLNQCGEMLRDLSQTPPKTEELEPELEEMLQVTIKTVADPKNFKGGGWSEDNLSAPSSFIPNAYNEIYAFYTEKSGFLTKI